MKKGMITIVLLAFIGPSLMTVWAQQRSGKGIKNQMYTRQYDTSSVETIEGEVVEIAYKSSRKNAATMGVHMIVNTGSERLPVHLGPAWYVEKQQQIRKGDKVTTTGSRINYNGRPALIAASITRNNMTLQLRDRNGFPAWRGWRRAEAVN
jgi:hypothetical protein